MNLPSRTSLALWSLLLLVPACDRSLSPECLEGAARASLRIKFGDAGAEPEDQPWRSAPVLLDIQGSNSGRTVPSTCTGLRVSPSGVLTAAHCFRDFESIRGTVGEPTLERTDPCVTAAQFSLEDVSVHPYLDAAYVRITDLDAASVRLWATLPNREERVVLAGFGVTNDGSTGTLHAIGASIISVDAERIMVEGHGGGACMGDSGGPLLVAPNHDSAGVLRRGSVSCLGKDEYVPTASLVDWLGALDPMISWYPPPPGNRVDEE